MGRAKLNGQSGGAKINGIIEEYVVQAGSNISVGDFVEFVNSNLSVVGSLTVTSAYNTNALKAIKLADEIVLVINTQDAGVNSYVTAQIITVSGTTISVGAKHTIISSIIGYNCTDIQRISDTKAIFSFCSDYTDYLGKAIVLSISGTSISVGTVLTFNASKTYTICSVVLDSARVLVTYVDNGNSNYLTAMVISVNGTSLSVGTKYIVSSSNSNWVSLSLIKTDKVVIGFTYVSGSDNYGGLKVLTISGTSISIGSLTVFHNKPTAEITCIVTSENYGFVVYRGYVANTAVYYVRVMPIEFSGTTVICGLRAIYTDSDVYEFTSISKISDGCYVLAFNDSNYSIHYGQAILINSYGNSVNIKGNVLAYRSARTYYSNIVPVSDSKAVAIFVDLSDSQVKALLLTTNSYVRNTTDKNAINGIAKTKAAAGETAKIYTL